MRHPFKISLLFGIPMIIIGVVLLLVNPQLEGNLYGQFVTPIIAFEFIQSQAEVAQYFNVAQPNTYRNDMLLGNNIDFLFMFFYSAFLGFTGLGILKQNGDKIIWLPIVLTIVMFFADLFENMTIASIIHSYFNQEEIPLSSFGNLKFFTWLKWGSIATVLFIYGGYFLQQNKFGKLLAGLGVLTFITAIIAFFNRSIFNEVLGGLTILSFLLIFIYNVLFKPKMQPA